MFKFNLLDRGNGVELWHSNGKYLVISRDTRFARYFNTIEEAKEVFRIKVSEP